MSIKLRFLPYHTNLSNAQLATLDKNLPTPMSEVPNMLKNETTSRGLVSSNGSGLTPAATVPIKRQNSRSRMTPREAAIAMTNGMIATHLSAAMNGVSVQMTRTGNNSSKRSFIQITRAIVILIFFSFRYDSPATTNTSSAQITGITISTTYHSTNLYSSYILIDNVLSPFFFSIHPAIPYTCMQFYKRKTLHICICMISPQGMFIRFHNIM